jgi:hypothetical protein
MTATREIGGMMAEDIEVGGLAQEVQKYVDYSPTRILTVLTVLTHSAPIEIHIDEETDR